MVPKLHHWHRTGQASPEERLSGFFDSPDSTDLTYFGYVCFHQAGTLQARGGPEQGRRKGTREAATRLG